MQSEVFNLSRMKQSLRLLDLQLPLNAPMVAICLLDPRPSRPARCLYDVVQERLEEAAKSQVRRMCTLKKKKVALNLPAWVVEEYQKRPKVEMARLLMNCNFDKARCLGPTMLYTINSN